MPMIYSYDLLCIERVSGRWNSAFHRIRVFWSPFLGHSLKGCQCLFLISRLINRLKSVANAFLSLSGTYFRVFRTLIVSNIDCQYLFLPFRIDTKNDIGSQFTDYTIITDRIMYRIYVQDWICGS